MQKTERPQRGIVFSLLWAGLTTILLISALWTASGSYFLRQADRAIQRRMTARQTLLLILEVETADYEFREDFLLNPINQAASLGKHKKWVDELGTMIDQLARVSSPADRASIQQLMNSFQQYKESFPQFLTFHHQRRLQDARWRSQWQEAGHNMYRMLDGMEPIVETFLSKAAAESAWTRRQLLWASGFILMMGLIVGGIVFYIFAISIARPLIQLSNEVVRVGLGCLDCSITVNAPGEVGILAQSFQEMVQNVHRNQAALIQSEKMAGIGQFAAGVAHDINNPIAVILGFSQTLLSGLPESDRMIMPLKSIEREGLRCKTLVQNLLAFSRGQGGGKPVMKPEDLNQVIEGALVLVVTLARSKKVELVRPVRLEIPPLSIDSNQIQQVVINLCTNAIDAMPDGGTLTVSLVNAGDHVEISVQDTGTGIPPEVQGRMFEAFFTTKEVGKGTGLGLSIISTIVKAHQGTVDVQSEMGKGTTFRIRLPLTLPVASASDARSMAA